MTDMKEDDQHMQGPELDYTRMKDAADRIKQRKEQESFGSMDVASIDALINQERSAIKQRYYKDKTGVQKLYLQILDVVGLGQKYQGQKMLTNYRLMVNRLDSVVDVLEEKRDVYTGEEKNLYKQTTEDRRQFEDYKVLITERRKLKEQYNSELDRLSEESLTGESSSVRELDLQCKVIDLENDLNILNNENNEIATRLRVADAAIVAYNSARRGINELLSGMIVQRAHVKTHFQKAELAYKLGTESGAESMRILYLESARLVKQAAAFFGEGTNDMFQELPKEGKLLPPSYGSLLPKEGKERPELWETYDRERQQKRTRS